MSHPDDRSGDMPQMTMKLYIVMLHKGNRSSVCAAYAHNEDMARKHVLGKHTGWVIDRVDEKDAPTVFRVFDSNWYEY